MYRKIKWYCRHTLRKLLSAFGEFRKTRQRKVYLSFGENCLTDDILKRHNIKSFSTPYSSGRSNIEYILQIERDRFADFLNPEYLFYADIEGEKVVRSRRYGNLRNTYNPMHMEGFEFTHHDVLGNNNAREKLARRARRMLRLRNKTLNIFYHSRNCNGKDTRLLLAHLAELKQIYEKRCKRVNVIVFSQIVIDDIRYRRVECQRQNGIYIHIMCYMNGAVAIRIFFGHDVMMI